MDDETPETMGNVSTRSLCTISDQQADARQTRIRIYHSLLPYIISFRQPIPEDSQESSSLSDQQEHS